MVAPLGARPPENGSGRAGGDTDRTRLRRLAHKAVTDPGVLHAVLDAGRVAHVALVDDDQPYAIPVGYARDGDRLLLHGSTGSRLFRRLAAGVPACVTVTLLDGLVLARSAFESSMHYRCAIVLGSGATVEGPAKLSALERITDHLLPGRWNDLREPTARELAATVVVAVPLQEWSVKVSGNPPEDAEGDRDLPIWAGVVPIVETLGEPIAAPDVDDATPVPDYLRTWR
jgi:hypothetical protein